MVQKILPPKTLVTNTSSQYTAVGAATLPLACDPLDEVHDGDTSYAARGSGGAASSLGFRHDLGFPGRFSAISAVYVRCRARRTDGVNHTYTLQIFLGGLSNTSGNFTLTSSYATQTYDVTSLRPGGGSWSEADFRDPTLEFRQNLASNPPTSRYTSLYMVFDGTPATVSLESQRLVASQKLAARLKQKMVTIGLPLRFMDLDLLEDFALSHHAFPLPDGAGAGLERWERALLTALRADVDPMANRVSVTAFDPREYRTIFWDVGQSKLSTKRTDVADGIARLNTGGMRIFTRASKAYGPDPSGIAVVEYGIDEEALTKEGIQLERASTNLIWNSAFGNGFANWTKLNDGVDSAAVTLDTAEVLFDETPEIATRQSVSILNGVSTEAGIEQTTGSALTGSGKYTISVWHHEDDVTAQLAVRVQNTTTGNWLQSNGTWAASEVDAAAFAISATKERDFLHLTLESTGSTVKIRPVNTGAGATTLHVYHVQIETGPGSSEIVSDAADETRAISKMKVSNDFGKRVLWTAHGHLVVEVIPYFSDTELSSGEEKMIWRAAYDASNLDEFLYKQGVGFVMRRTVGGSPVSATNASLAVRDAAVKIAFRWTGSESELGLTAYTLSVFADGVKGTDAVAGGAPVPPSTMDVWIGQDGSDASPLDAAIRRIKSGPFVPTDLEIARLL